MGIKWKYWLMCEAILAREVSAIQQGKSRRMLSRLGIRLHTSGSTGWKKETNVDSKNTAWKNASFRAYADT